MLSIKDYALLTNALELPSVVDDILYRDPADLSKELNHDMIYALHDLISDLHPDTALLAMAVSSLKIINFHAKQGLQATMTSLECDRIVGEYGALWLQNAAHEMMNVQNVIDAVGTVQEDLESLVVHLEPLLEDLAQINDEAADLVGIFIAQARAQALMAEHLVEELNLQSLSAHVSKDQSAAQSNVIHFPTRH